MLLTTTTVYMAWRYDEKKWYLHRSVFGHVICQVPTYTSRHISSSRVTCIDVHIWKKKTKVDRTKWLAKQCWHSPTRRAPVSHKRTVPSKLPEAKILPLEQKSRLVILAVCPVRWAMSWAFRKSQIKTLLSESAWNKQKKKIKPRSTSFLSRPIRGLEICTQHPSVPMQWNCPLGLS